MLSVFKREMKMYFSSPAGYIFMGSFLLISGIFFALYNLMSASPNYNSVLASITFVFLFAIPLLTMRLMSEEARQKTDQLLLTSPLKISDIVFGKYFAAVTVFLITLLITCLYPIILSFFGKVPVGEIVGGYVGFFLLGSAFISIGLFISSLTENQVTAGIVTFGVMLFIWLLDGIQQGLPTGTIPGVVFASILVAAISLFVYFSIRNTFVTIGTAAVGGIIIVIVYMINSTIYDAFIVKFFEWFSLLKRYQDFAMGVISLSPIIYYVTFSFAFVFLTIRRIDKKRWS